MTSGVKRSGLAAFGVVAFLILAGMASAGYTKSYSDPSDIANANADISKVSAQAVGNDVQVKLEVRGTIQQNVDYTYWIWVGGDSETDAVAWIFLEGNDVTIVSWAGGSFSTRTEAPNIAGGTWTVLLTQAEAGPESSFDIWGYSLYSSESAGTFAWDWAGPGYTGGTGGTTTPEGALALGLSAVLWAVIIAVIVIIVVVVVLVLILRREPTVPPRPPPTQYPPIQAAPGAPPPPHPGMQEPPPEPYHPPEPPPGGPEKEP